MESNDDPEANRMEYMRYGISTFISKNRMEKNKDIMHKANQRVTNISDFHSIEHHPQYSSSSRGYVGQDKSNYSLSPNHAKAPSNNFM